MSQTSFTFDDALGTPQYPPGLQLGIFIFTTQDGRWHVRWNGNEKGQRPIRYYYLWSGDIRAARIKNITTFRFEPNQPDTYTYTAGQQAQDDVLSFSGVVYWDEDGLDFDIEGDEIHFSLAGTIKDQPQVFLHPGLVFVGPNQHNPSATDFVITRSAPPPTPAPGLYWSNTGPANLQSALLTDVPQPATLLEMTYTAYGLALDSAAGKLYWGDSNKTINTANLDGSGLTTLVSGLAFLPYGLALDLAHNLAYCADSHGGNIYAVDLGSGQATLLISKLASPVDVALDLAASKLYWVEYNGNSLGCANLDGTDSASLLTGLNYPQALAVDPVNGLVYVADKNSIQRMNMDGSDSALVASLPDALGNMLSRRLALDVPAGQLYYTDRAAFVIQRIAANASNGVPETVLSSLSSPALLAVG